MTREEFFDICRDIYDTEPDYPFRDAFDSAVLRHSNNKKWYAIVMEVPESKFGIDSDRVVSVVNLKVSEEMRGFFGKDKGIFPAYHMNKRHWISCILERTPHDLLRILLSESFDATSTKVK